MDRDVALKIHYEPSGAAQMLQDLRAARAQAEGMMAALRTPAARPDLAFATAGYRPLPAPSTPPPLTAFRRTPSPPVQAPPPVMFQAPLPKLLLPPTPPPVFWPAITQTPPPVSSTLMHRPVPITAAATMATGRAQAQQSPAAASGGCCEELLSVGRHQLAVQLAILDHVGRQRTAQLAGIGGLSSRDAARLTDSVLGLSGRLRSITGGLTSTLGAIGVGASLGGLASAAGPAVSQTLSYSIEAVAGELGIVLIPTIVEFSALLQTGAQWIQSWSSETRASVNAVVQWTAALGAGAYVFSQLWNAGRGAIGMLQDMRKMAVSPLGQLGIAAVGVSVAFGTLLYAADRLANADQERADSLRNNIPRIQNSGANYQDFLALPQQLRGELRNATSDQARLAIAQREANRLRAERPGLQATAEVVNEGGAQALGAAVDRLTYSSAAPVHGANALLRWTGLNNYVGQMPTPGSVATSAASGQANLTVQQNASNIAILEAIIRNQGQMPRPAAELDPRMAAAVRMVFSTGGFQSRQMDIGQVHSMIQQESIRDPVEQSRFERQMRALDDLVRYAAQQGITLEALVSSLSRPTTE
jgi:hypothetical protein